MAGLSVHLGVCSPNTLYWFILITPDIGTLYWVGQKVRLVFFFPDHKKWNELFGQPSILLRKYTGVESEALQSHCESRAHSL